MTAKDFLLDENNKWLNRSVFAKLMYGDNPNSTSRLAHKLNGDRNWLDSDEQNAIRVLNDLQIRISEVVK